MWFQDGKLLEIELTNLVWVFGGKVSSGISRLFGKGLAFCFVREMFVKVARPYLLVGVVCSFGDWGWVGMRRWGRAS